ncbi:hypothetical protein BFW01_g8927 [Lasiodiplodia theobromae]|nr:hypothetical protein BFW01_g8927 [Lasiodiplodia theobromae]
MGDTKRSRPRRFPLQRIHKPQRPAPLDQSRRQSLSGISAHNQSQSPFFKLPIELRRAIYAQVGLAINAPIHCFTHRVIDEHLPPRVYGKVCTLPQDGSIAYWDPDVDKYCRPCKMKADQVLHNYPEAFTEFQPAGVSPSVVPLMQTCRILYLELSTTLYADPTFTFTCLWTLHDFLLSPATTLSPTAHNSLIRHLSLTWNLHTRFPPAICRDMTNTVRADAWRELWAHIGGTTLPALRRLRLELADGVGKRCRMDPYFEKSVTRRRFYRLRGPAGMYQDEEEEEVVGRRRPERLWVAWLEPVGKALEGREEDDVEVQGGIWCRLNEPGSLHAVIKGGGGRRGGRRGRRRVLVLADGGEEVEW